MSIYIAHRRRKTFNAPCPGCLAQGLVSLWAREHCVRWGSGSPHGKGASRRGVVFPIVKYRRSDSRVLFDGKFHQVVAGWTVNLSGFIQICLILSHVVVGLTVRILLCSVLSTRSGPFATRLSVCLSVYLSHSCAVLKRLNGSSCPFAWGLPLSIVTLLYYMWLLIPLK